MLLQMIGFFSKYVRQHYIHTYLEIILLTCYSVLYLWMPSRTVRKSPVGETGDVATTPLWRCTSTQHTGSIYGSNKSAFLFFSQCTKLYLALFGINMMPISFWLHRTRLRPAFGSRDNQANVKILKAVRPRGPPEFHCLQRSKILRKSQNGIIICFWPCFCASCKVQKDSRICKEAIDKIQ